MNDKHKKIGTFSFIIQGKYSAPQGKLQEYFEVYHQNKEPESLNPCLREQWIIASIADQIACRIIGR